MATVKSNSSRKRRRSRWDDQPPLESNRNSRWSGDEPPNRTGQNQLPEEFTGGIEFDVEYVALNSRLIAITHKLQSISSKSLLDDRPESARSPSPQPVYDNLGIRVNTRECRAREKLNRERLEIISLIMKKNPDYKPPADYKKLLNSIGKTNKHENKLSDKIYIPVKEYPCYNFVRLIVGPRGHNRRRLEKKTGAKISVRGKGSGTNDPVFELSVNEDLHVCVEAETKESLEAAVGMVQKILLPFDKSSNEPKWEQIRELGTVKGVCKECGETGHWKSKCPSASRFRSKVNRVCVLCEEPGHRKSECPYGVCLSCGETGHWTSACPRGVCMLCGKLGHGKSACPRALPVKSKVDAACMLCGEPGHWTSASPRASTSKSNVISEICGHHGHCTTDCPQKCSTKMKGGYQNFSTELGVTVSESCRLSCANSSNNTLQAGLGVIEPKSYDDTNVHIYDLPRSVDEHGLIRLFSPFGKLVVAKIMSYDASGLSKGYGFVTYADSRQANFAIASMNGYILDGNTLSVRVASSPLQPPYPALDQPVGAYASQQYDVGLRPWMQTPDSRELPIPPTRSCIHSSVPQCGVQSCPPPAPSSSLFMSQSVSLTDSRYSFASFEEPEQSVPLGLLYAYGNSLTSTQDPQAPCPTSPYIYRLSNGTILPPLTPPTSEPFQSLGYGPRP